MKLTSPKGLFLTGLVLLFSNICLAEEEPCDGRTCLDGPGEAEVVAGTGYHNTLFDSADNKCQHCHNDLYDTWKTSMHAQSWKDPIFQSKYQDFLRLQISKIGSKHPVSDIEYKPVMGTKAAQVCIKCHAPAAYYSNDTVSVMVDGVEALNPQDQTWRSEVLVPSSGKTVETKAKTAEGSSKIQQIHIRP